MNKNGESVIADVEGDSQQQMETLLQSRTSRRRAFKNLTVGILGATALGLDSPKSHADTQKNADANSAYPKLNISAGDLAILDFALNLEYLEAQFYSYATTGAGIDAQGVELTGRGKQGSVNVPSSTKVPFSNPNVQQYATEIAADELAHVNFLRGVVTASGIRPIAQPAIDLVNSFNTAASAAGLGATFTPFDNDLDFLLGAFIFEDVGVTAYHGALMSILNKTILTSAAGILGTEAYHASSVRTEIYEYGTAAVTAAQAISSARNALGGEGLDQGIVFDSRSNIVPADSNAIVFARTTRLVLNIVYLGVNAKKGGFFPNGTNA
jgi:hypothetical protein